MLNILIGLGVLFIGAYFLFSRLTKQKTAARKAITAKKTSPSAKPHTEQPYKSVEISFAHFACEAVQAYKGKPILMKDAPILPLKDCNAETCKCRFVRLDDRRTKSRRAEKSVATDIMMAEKNKRDKSDRRRFKK